MKLIACVIFFLFLATSQAAGLNGLFNDLVKRPPPPQPKPNPPPAQPKPPVKK
jgi:hypothetical protein